MTSLIEVPASSKNKLSCILGYAEELTTAVYN
jgi:hypothetical protein